MSTHRQQKDATCKALVVATSAGKCSVEALHEALVLGEAVGRSVVEMRPAETAMPLETARMAA